MKITSQLLFGTELQLTAACIVFALINPAPAQTWTLTSAPSGNWSSIASSADGTRLAATIKSGGIYISTNSGATWTLSGAPSKGWYSVAASASGSNLVATADGIYTSTNMGVVWSFRTNLMRLESVASSADGIKLVAAAWGPGYVYTSTNAGATWQKTTAPEGYWTSVASSADGSGLMVGYGGYVYISTNSGATWIQKAPGSSSAAAVAVAFSADKNTVVWATGGGFQSGGIYVSTNTGAKWITNTVSGSGLSSVALSADGRQMVALDGGTFLTSTNSGTSFTNGSDPGVPLKFITASADGSSLAAVVSGGGIYTLHSIPSPQLNFTPSPTNFILAWIVPSKNFVLQQSPDLVSWSSVTDTPALDLTNLNNKVSVSLSNSSRFYRLATP